MDFKKLESKWQKRWEEKSAFKVKENPKKKKLYVLEQFPYPSGTGLHMGHAFIYTIGDVYARFKRMQGFNVLYPMGFDSFGLPAENAAIKAKSHPKKFTESAIKNFIKHFKSFGNSYDFSRMLETHKPEFYKWDQWIFLKMFEKGLAYKRKAPVNWCGKCNTVLANEQVQNGKCWRHEDTNVEVKNLEQWFFKITDYAQELYDDLDHKLTEWPEFIKRMQKNWIGRSEGTEVLFDIDGKKFPVFTTRVDTIFGVTFLVISAQHPELMSLVTEKQKQEVEKFLKKVKSTKEEDMDKMAKEGVFTGSYAIHPLTKEKIPVWVGNFVVAEYGAGMVMAVPAHDQRDFEFAKKYNIPIKVVIQSDKPNKNSNEAFTEYGKLINSGDFSDLTSYEAKEHITIALETKNLGKKTINFRLRDWLISRQRFWGTPIPIIYCNTCGVVPVPEKDLPVVLPDKVNFSDVKNPLVDYKPFVNVKCPKCNSPAKRETDTMDTFVNSSWYFLRYTDNNNKKEIFDKKKAEYWMPIDVYIGGKEHAVLHDIYFRFYTKFLRDLGLIKVDEPARSLFNQGFVYGSDGRKMSKSYGNVVIPEDAAMKFGVDSTRMFLISVASPDKDFNWSDTGAESTFKFISRVYEHAKSVKFSKSSPKIEHKVNNAIKKITNEIESFKYNLAVINLRGLFDSFENEISKKDYEKFLKMLSIFSPHIAEELWEKSGGKGFISLSDWPEADESKINDDFDKQDQALEKTVSDILNILKIVREKQNKDVEKIYLYVLPPELKNYNARELSLRTNKHVEIFAVNDKAKYDPENKSSKAKFGKPAIFVE